MNNVLKISLLLLLTILVLAGCKTTRSVYKQPIKEEGADYLVNKLKENELDFNWLSAKFSLEMLVDKKKTSFKGQIRIKKDSAIWVSFTPALGIEVARLMITNDSVKLINRINDTYFIGDYAFLNDFLQTGIDFDVLQSFIIGNDFQYYEAGEFRASIDNMDYRLSAAARHKIKQYVKAHEIPQVFVQNIWLDPELFKITRVNIKEVTNQNRKLEAIYSDFVEVNEQLFPSDMIFEISSSDTKVWVNIEFSRIVLQDPLRFPFNIPDKFTRIL